MAEGLRQTWTMESWAAFHAHVQRQKQAKRKEREKKRPTASAWAKGAYAARQMVRESPHEAADFHHLAQDMVAQEFRYSGTSGRRQLALAERNHAYYAGVLFVLEPYLKSLAKLGEVEPQPSVVTA